MVGHQSEAFHQNRSQGESGGTGIGRGESLQPLLLLAAPFIGLLFILLMPLAWMIAGAALLARKTAVVLFKAAAKSISFGWRPVEAYLAGRRSKRTRR